MTAGKMLPTVGIMEHATSVRVYLFELVHGIYRYAVTVLVLALLFDINRVGQQTFRHFGNCTKIGNNLLFQFFLFFL